jgi:putative transposase
VSDDNPYSEALFKTLKYCPHFPRQPFESIEEARQWVQGFAHWYNEQHLHSALKFVTPGQRHRGEDRAILQQREQLYAAARAQHPERWSGSTRDWTPESTVLLNPGRPPKTEENNTQKSA